MSGSGSTLWTPTDPEGPERRDGITRRRALSTAAGGAAIFAAGDLLAACGSSGSGGSTSSSTASSTGGSPKKGGHLTVGMITGGNAETINPAVAVNLPDICRIRQLFSPLYDLAPDLTVKPNLVAETETSADAKVWTIRLKKGITFHNGKPLTADDVLFTMKGWANPANFNHFPLGVLIDYPKVKKLDSHTLRIPFTQGVAEFPSLTAYFNSYIVQDGETDFKHPSGTGPFKLVSFTPGTSSVMTAFGDYFESPYPYIDTLTINSSFTDETARLNALLAGDIDAQPFMPFSLAKAQKSSNQISVVQSAPAPGFQDFCMRVDSGVFKDVNVRQAMKLIIDRPALLESVLDGFGAVAYDVPLRGFPYFDASLKREQDIEQAKFLLKKAGQSDLTVELQTSNAVDGFVQAATLFAQQAKAAGVTINLKQEPASQYFDTSTLYLKMRFSQTYWESVESLSQFYLEALTSKAPYPETHWTSSDKLIFEACAATDKSKATELWAEVQKQQFNEGGYIVWANFSYVDGLGKNVKGIEPSPVGPLAGWHLWQAYLD